MSKLTTESAVAPGERIAASIVAWRLSRAISNSGRLRRKGIERSSSRRIVAWRRAQRV